MVEFNVDGFFVGLAEGDVKVRKVFDEFSCEIEGDWMLGVSRKKENWS